MVWFILKLFFPVFRSGGAVVLSVHALFRQKVKMIYEESTLFLIAKIMI